MPDLEEIQAKLDAGQALTPEEEREVMSQTHDDFEEHDDSEDIKRENEAKDGEAAPATAVSTGDGTGKEGAPAGEGTGKTAAPAGVTPGKPAETPAASAESGEGKGKEAGTAAAAGTAEGAGSPTKIEEQLAKPEGQEDLTGFTATERGLFREARHQRHRAQEAEAERDALKFEKLKAKVEKEQEEEPADDDFLTHKQVKERVGAAVSDVEARARKSLIGVWHREATRDHRDLSLVLDIGEAIIQASPEAQAKIREAYEAGENPALVTYDLIKSDPKLAELAAKAGLILQDGVYVKAPVTAAAAAGTETGKTTTTTSEPKKAEAEALKKAKQVQENAAKTVTTGAAGGGGAGGAEEWTVERVRALSDAEFNHLPAATRHRILQQFG